MGRNVMAISNPSILVLNRLSVLNWPKPEMKLRKPRMMYFMLKMLKQAVINTRLFDRYAKAIQNSGLMSLKQCESHFFACMFSIKVEPPAEKYRPFHRWKDHTSPCQSTYTSLWLKHISKKKKSSTIRQSISCGSLEVIEKVSMVLYFHAFSFEGTAISW